MKLRGITIISLGLLLASTSTAASAAGVDPSLNWPQTWEVPGQTSCAKTDLGDGVRSFTLPHDGSVYALLVVKAGRVSEPLADVVPGAAYASASGKDLSHVIVCTVIGGTGGDGGWENS